MKQTLILDHPWMLPTTHKRTALVPEFPEKPRCEDMPKRSTKSRSVTSKWVQGVQQRASVDF
jgi:hypothetical protein